MSVNVGINGLGRIGRCLIRAVAERDDRDIKLVAINGTGSIDQYITLLKYDSIHGKFPFDIKTEGNSLIIKNQKIKFLSNRDPETIPWKENNVEIVLECTGKFKTKEEASKHIKSGAKKVIISAPSSNPDATIVYGVNNDILKPNDNVISVGSCTTNALAPIVKLLHNAFEIESGYMTTIHAYTNDQTILDNRHSDVRRARACGLSMIPTSTGAAKAIGVVLPELQGKLSGSAIRVPTPNVSMIDLSATTKKKTTATEVNNVILEASKKDMKGIIEFAEEKLVSIDFNHNTHSTIFDPYETHVNNNLLRIVSWYDNEWGFSNRMLDVSSLISKTK
ncbi:MAG: type I glyceraldehyde-3-phosphate dehydrogenase [Alphaproteobacteria bacterium]|nr:type I glyceraldehyde-3-phosphate dehydrogenase [Alphaproteobacteria bacterium]